MRLAVIACRQARVDQMQARGENKYSALIDDFFACSVYGKVVLFSSCLDILISILAFVVFENDFLAQLDLKRFTYMPFKLY